MSRSKRRHHQKRIKNKSQQIIKDCWINDTFSEKEKEDLLKTGNKIANHMACCSRCSCCKNPRRNGWNSGKGKMTVQERKSYEKYNL